MNEKRMNPLKYSHYFRGFILFAYHMDTVIF